MKFKELSRETVFLPTETRKEIKRVWADKYIDKMSKNEMVAKWIVERLNKEK